MIDKKKLADMSGDKGGNKAPEYKLNQLQLNGQKGVFVMREILSEKGEDGKYPKKTLEGKEMKIVMLKHRRVLSSFAKVNGLNEIASTNEHNHKDDRVILYNPKPQPAEKGIASELRLKYPKLKTSQIVYSYVPDLKQIMKLVVKGSSLGSNQKAKEVMGYYDYLSSFGKDEHCFEYFTILKPVEEQNDMGSYYAIEFVRGEKLSDEQLEKVGKMIEEVHGHIQEADEYYRKKTMPTAIDDKPEIDDVVEDLKNDDVQYPEEDINIEDIPF